MLISALHVEPYARNEDRAVVLAVAHGLVVVVADGAGGMPGGAAAADAVVRAVATSAADLTEMLRKVDDACERDARIGEAAVVVVVVQHDGRLSGASAGDCEAWHIGSDRCAKLTQGQRRKKRVGCGVAEPVAFEAVLAERDAVVVASDGLFGCAI